MEQLEIVRAPGRTPAVTILHFKGPFNIGTLFRFQEMLREPDITSVILELSNVTRIDSAALGSLLAHWAHTRRNNNSMAIAGMSPRVRSIFEITRTDKLLPIFETIEAAEAGMK